VTKQQSKVTKLASKSDQARRPKIMDPKFPDDIYVSAMIGLDHRKTKQVRQSAHLIHVHKWNEFEVRVMQANRI
jgi:hypothetical protein